MRFHARAVASVAVVGVSSLAALVSACTAAEPEAPPSVVTAPPRDPGPLGSGDDTVAAPAAAPSSGSCEDLGRLVGTSLQAKLASSTFRSVSLPLANRPSTTRLAVVGVGGASELAGKSAALGAAANGNYETCTHCLLLAIGCSEDSCDRAAFFFPRSGTATFTTVPSADGEPFRGTLKDAVLDEVTIDWSTGVSTVVSGGACVRIQELSFDAIAQSSSPGVEDAGTSGDAGVRDADSEDGAQSITGSSGGSGKGGGGGNPIVLF